MTRDAVRLLAALGALTALTLVYSYWLEIANATIVALSFLVVVLVAAAASRLWVPAATSLAAMLYLNYFFLPPVGTWTIADPQNWVALFTFLAVSLVASNLSSAVRARAREALDRRDEMARLFDLSRDVLLMTDSGEALPTLTRVIARRFNLDYAAICLPRGQDWDVYESGTPAAPIDRRALSLALAGAEGGPELDAAAPTQSGHRVMSLGGVDARMVPLRLGTRPIGLLAAVGRPVEPATLDALGSLAAIAIERAQFLEERKTAELARQGEELKSALLASIGHDLRTPLTAIRVAASNLRASWLSETERREQGDVVLAEVERLTRLFQNILDMARIDAGAVATEKRWVHPSEILEAAREQVGQTLTAHMLDTSAISDTLVQLDPRLTASALAHVLENAAQHSPAGSTISVEMRDTAEGLTIVVRDQGAGISPEDLPRLFDRFYRGDTARKRPSGTGMGLSIARGLLAAEQARIQAENRADGGAQFTIAVPAETRGMIVAADQP